MLTEMHRPSFAANYEQMLGDVNKRLVTIGINDQVKTDKTRMLRREYEDPVFVLTKEH